MAMALLSAVMGGSKDDQDNITGNPVTVELEEEQAMENLAVKVEQATLETVKKNAHCSLPGVMEGWKVKDQIGDNCPRVMMATPCAVPDHKPVNGKGFFCLLGDSLATTRAEVVKYVHGRHYRPQMVRVPWV